MRNARIGRLRRAFWVAALSLIPGPAPAQTPEQLREICEVPAVRDALFAQLEGQQLEIAKVEVAYMCEQIDLPDTPLHDGADSSTDATHTEWVYAASYRPDGRTIASASDDGTIRIWDAETGQLVRRLGTAGSDSPEDPTGLGRLFALTILGDGTRAVVKSDRHPLRVIDLDTGNIVAEIDHSADSSTTAMAATADILFIGGGPGDSVEALDAETLAVRYRLRGHEPGFVSIAASEAAGLVATADASPAASGPGTIRVRLWVLDTGEVIDEFIADGRITTSVLAFSRDGMWLAITNEGSVSVYSAAERRPAQTFLVHPFFEIFDVAFTADGSGLITCQAHPILWDIATGEKLHLFGPFIDICQSVDVSPDGRFAVTTHRNTDLRIWEIGTGTFHRRLGINLEPTR